MSTKDTVQTKRRAGDSEDLRRRIAQARRQLAELDTLRTTEAARVAAIQSRLFDRLREFYHRRDHLEALLQYRERLLATLKAKQHDQAKEAEREYTATTDRIDEEYEEAARGFTESQPIPLEQRAELLQLWKKLVKLYHPDRFAHDPELQATYDRLTSVINHARDTGDIDTLREIAADPEGFIKRQGWRALDFRDEADVEELEQLYESLKREITSAKQALEDLRNTPEYKLSEMIEADPALLDQVVTKKKTELEKECAELEQRAAKILLEIESVKQDASDADSDQPTTSS